MSFLSSVITAFPTPCGITILFASKLTARLEDGAAVYVISYARMSSFVASVQVSFTAFPKFNASRFVTSSGAVVSVPSNRDCSSFCVNSETRYSFTDFRIFSFPDLFKISFINFSFVFSRRSSSKISAFFVSLAPFAIASICV